MNADNGRHELRGQVSFKNIRAAVAGAFFVALSVIAMPSIAAEPIKKGPIKTYKKPMGKKKVAFTAMRSAGGIVAMSSCTPGQESEEECEPVVLDSTDFQWDYVNEDEYLDFAEVYLSTLEQVQVPGKRSYEVCIDGSCGLYDDVEFIGEEVFNDSPKMDKKVKKSLLRRIIDWFIRPAKTVRSNICVAGPQLTQAGWATVKDITVNSDILERQLGAATLFFQTTPNSPVTERLYLQIKWTDGTVDEFEPHANGTVTHKETLVEGSGVSMSECSE